MQQSLTKITISIDFLCITFAYLCNMGGWGWEEKHQTDLKSSIINSQLFSRELLVSQ